MGVNGEDDSPQRVERTQSKINFKTSVVSVLLSVIVFSVCANF